MWEWLSNELRSAAAPIVSAPDRQRIVQLADDLVDLGRAFEGTLRVERRELDLACLLSSARDTCTPALQAQGQALCFDLPPDPVCFWGDAGRLLPILRTLLLGVARSMPEDPIQLLVRVTDAELELRVGDPELDVTEEWMSDSPEMLQAHEVSREPLGVRLAVARHVIELHGGALEVGRTWAGCTSQFTIRLPLSPPGHGRGGQDETPRRMQCSMSTSVL